VPSLYFTRWLPAPTTEFLFQHLIILPHSLNPLHLRTGPSFSRIRYLYVFFFFCCGAAIRRGSRPPHSCGFLDHTQRRTTVGRTPLDEWISSSQKSLPDNTQHSQQTNLHAPGGIRTHDLNRRTAAELCLRPRGRWDQQLHACTGYKILVPESPRSSSRIITLQV